MLIEKNKEMKQKLNTKETIFKIAEIISETEGFELVFNDEPESAHYLKKDGERFGRDLELYNFFEEIMGIEEMLVTFTEEIVLPSGVKSAIEAVKYWGLEVYDPKIHDTWLEIFK